MLLEFWWYGGVCCCDISSTILFVPQTAMYRNVAESDECVWERIRDVLPQMLFLMVLPASLLLVFG